MDPFLRQIVQEGRELYFSDIQFTVKDFLVDVNVLHEVGTYIKAKNLSKASAMLKPYIPLLQEHLGVHSYRIRNINIPLKFMMDIDPHGSNASFNYELTWANNKREVGRKIIGIKIYPILLMYPKQYIDAVVAHELAHAKRVIERREIKRYPNSDKLKAYLNNQNENWEEFWTDREIKKTLPLINRKYNNRAERRAAIYAFHQCDPDRSKIIGHKAILGRWWDRLVAFDNSIDL